MLVAGLPSPSPSHSCNRLTYSSLSNPFGADVTNIPVSELLLRTSIQARAMLSKSETAGSDFVRRPTPAQSTHWMSTATIARERATLSTQFDFNLYSDILSEVDLPYEEGVSRGEPGTSSICHRAPYNASKIVSYGTTPQRRAKINSAGPKNNAHSFSGMAQFSPKPSRSIPYSASPRKNSGGGGGLSDSQSQSGGEQRVSDQGAKAFC